jgi:hypothetical protein
LLGAGASRDPYQKTTAEVDPENHRQSIEAITSLLAGEAALDPRDGTRLDPFRPKYWPVASGC